jgi:hypothetical protein
MRPKIILLLKYEVVSQGWMSAGSIDGAAKGSAVGREK